MCICHLLVNFQSKINCQCLQGLNLCDTQGKTCLKLINTDARQLRIYVQQMVRFFYLDNLVLVHILIIYKRFDQLMWHLI